MQTWPHFPCKRLLYPMKKNSAKWQLFMAFSIWLPLMARPLLWPVKRAFLRGHLLLHCNSLLQSSKGLFFAIFVEIKCGKTYWKSQLFATMVMVKLQLTRKKDITVVWKGDCGSPASNRWRHINFFSCFLIQPLQKMMAYERSKVEWQSTTSPHCCW